MFLSIVLLSISIYFLMGMYLQEKKDDQVMDRVQELFELTQSDDAKADISADSTEEGNTTVNEGLLAIHAENEDCIGWIRIDGTAIDYPVMHRPQEKEYYLHRDFYGENSANGSLYLAENCEPDASDNLIIYGHHMNSGKMFADLEKYKSNEFYEEHPMIQYSTLHGDETYQIVAAFSTPVYTGQDFAYYDFIKAANEAEYDAYISACRSRSYYDTGVQAVFGEKLLTLSTCEYSQQNGRMVVVAKKTKG